MKAMVCLLLALAPAFGAAQAVGSGDESAAAHARLEQRVRAAERQARAATAGLNALRLESTRVTKQLEEAHAATKAQADQLEGMKSALVAAALRIDSVSAESDSQSKVLATSIAARSRWFAALLAAVVLLLVGEYLYRRRREQAAALGVEGRIYQVLALVRAGEERSTKADTALADGLLEALARLKEATPASTTNDGGRAPEVDHNLPTKLADEIHRMRKRLAAMPEDTKGLTPLRKSLERLESELLAYGYEIVDPSGKPYSENLSVKARFIPSDDLAAGERIISKVVLPQLNYRGVVVRMADVEVGIGG